MAMEAAQTFDVKDAKGRTYIIGSAGGAYENARQRYEMKPLTINMVPIAAEDERRILELLIARYNLNPSNPGHTPIITPARGL